MSSTVPLHGPDLRYPIGHHEPPGSITADDLAAARMDIAMLPKRLRSAVDSLDEQQLDTPYRDDGWTVRQLVHHVADSHLNAVLRFRFALTETDPVIRPYDEGAWALLPDASAGPIDTSLALLDGLHARWTMLLQKLTSEQWQRAYVHPVNGRTPLDRATLLYAWHSRHHTAHVMQLRAAQGW